MGSRVSARQVAAQARTGQTSARSAEQGKEEEEQKDRGVRRPDGPRSGESYVETVILTTLLRSRGCWGRRDWAGEVRMAWTVGR